MTSPGDGRMLGRYQLLFMLGQGGMGEVHLARLSGAAGFEKLCIVKTVLPSLMGDQNFIDRFHHEARVLVQLTHSNIAQVYDMGDVDGSLYMAIEYVPGVDLSRVETRIERQQALMPVPIAVYIGQQIAEALGYAHRKVGGDGVPLGIVHRDVSPQNVMVSYEGEVKVIDFGLAKSTARSKQTLPSTVMGKLGYMSPEQALAKPVDFRSDIFSAGIVLWEMLAGRSMYPGGTMSEMVAQMAVAEVPSLTGVRSGISPTLEQVVMRALAKDPAARFQRADDFARALNELAVREQLTAGAEEVGNFVRMMCPEEFAAERLLQSKLSLMRKGGVVKEIATSPEIEGTLLRPSPAAGVAKLTASGQDMTPAQRAMSMVQPSSVGLSAPPQAPLRLTPAKVSSQVSGPVAEPEAALSIPKSRTPVIVVGLLAFIGVAAAALLTLQNDEPKPEPAPVPPVQVAAVVPAVPTPKTEPDEPLPVKKEEVPDKREQVVLSTIAVEGKVWKVLRKDGEDLMLLDKGDKLSAGERINLVGEPDASNKRPVYAQGAVLSVKGSIATLVFDEDVALPDKVFAAKDASPKRLTASVAKREHERDPQPEPSESAKSAEAPKAVEPVHGEQPKPAEPPKTVVSAEPAKLPESVKPPDSVKPHEPIKMGPSGAQLFGSIRVSMSAKEAHSLVFIRSQNRFGLSDCEIRLPSNSVYRFGTTLLYPNMEAKVGLREFRADTRPPDPQFKSAWAAVYCREGTGYWKTTYDPRR